VVVRIAHGASLCVKIKGKNDQKIKYIIYNLSLTFKSNEESNAMNYLTIAFNFFQPYCQTTLEKVIEGSGQ